MQLLVPKVKQIVTVLQEARQAMAVGRAFADEVEKTLEDGHPLKEKALVMVKEFDDLDAAIDAVMSSPKKTAP